LGKEWGKEQKAKKLQKQVTKQAEVLVMERKQVESTEKRLEF
jgi:hypothetical protein